MTAAPRLPTAGSQDLSPDPRLTPVCPVCPLTTGYGSVTASVDVGSGSYGVPISTLITSLGSAVTYHFWLVASNAGGVVILPLAAPRITGLTRLGGGAFQIHFTYAAGASFEVFATTNPALPINQWSMIGPATESPGGSGQFEFTDPQAANYPMRIYRAISP